VNNRDVAQVFDEIADLLEIKGEQIYRVLAYRRAAESIRSLGQDIAGMQKEGSLESIPGVGKAIASKIDELIQTGSMEFHERLKGEIPVTLVEILRVSDVGPKKAARFWKELGITTLDQLERAARNGRLRELPGMGERSEGRILASIEALRRRQGGRIPIGTARPIAEGLLQRLRALPVVSKAEMAGSLRRWRETVGDIDLLVGASDPAAVMESAQRFPEIARIKGQGETKFSAELVDGLRVQLWVHPPERFGTALQYATGSQVSEPCGTTSSGRGCIYLTGGIIQQQRGAVGLVSGEGYKKRYSYDACAATNPPPYFPTTGHFSRGHYYEVEPTNFNIASYWQLLIPSH
jgi:DNA polymerase (family 10)